jgi:hypothetical protein
MMAAEVGAAALAPLPPTDRVAFDDHSGNRSEPSRMAILVATFRSRYAVSAIYDSGACYRLHAARTLYIFGGT